jgi:hypothetical protein
LSLGDEEKAWRIYAEKKAEAARSGSRELDCPDKPGNDGVS